MKKVNSEIFWRSRKKSKKPSKQKKERVHPLKVVINKNREFLYLPLQLYIKQRERKSRKMLNVNEVIEVQDKSKEIEMFLNKLSFVVNETLNELEERISTLEKEGRKEVLYYSQLERIYSLVDIANDYENRIRESLETQQDIISGLLDKELLNEV